MNFFLAASDSLLASRRDRMERLLNTMYVRSSDSLVTRAIRWAQLSLDALVVEGEDTLLIPGLPWHGEVDGRATSQSVAGVDLSTGTYRVAGAILRALATLQDTVAGSATAGRIPERAGRSGRSYAGADVTPWFVREMYDHVSRSNDTGLVRQLFPTVVRSIEGTMATSTDTSNLLVHGGLETWMNPRFAGAGGSPRRGSPRGDRASEVQALWYFQQIAGSFMARFMKDWKRAERWDTTQARTATAFNEQFIDTSGLRIADHLTPDGRPVFDTRPNGLLCLDIVWYDGVRTETVGHIAKSLLYPHGVGTLAPGDPRFQPVFGPSTEAGHSYHDGPVWTWLAGHMVYALTRYDHQDFAYRITSLLARRLLDRDVVGALPEVFDAATRGGEAVPRAAGRYVCASALAEFVRSMYQDYLGVRVDGSSGLIAIAPKLPAQYTDADFSVFAGESEVRVAYDLERGRPRLLVSTPNGTGELKVQVLWTLAGGNGWRGTVTVPPDTPVWVEFGEDDAEVSQDGRPAELTGKWKIRNFSRRNELTGLSFLSVSAR
jgi:glycogen debranching enzyme